MACIIISSGTAGQQQNRGPLPAVQAFDHNTTHICVVCTLRVHTRTCASYIYTLGARRPAHARAPRGVQHIYGLCSGQGLSCRDRGHGPTPTPAAAMTLMMMLVHGIAELVWLSVPAMAASCPSVRMAVLQCGLDEISTQCQCHASAGAAVQVPRTAGQGYQPYQQGRRYNTNTYMCWRCSARRPHLRARTAHCIYMYSACTTRTCCIYGIVVGAWPFQVGL